MPKIDKMMRNFRSLEDERKKLEEKQVPLKKLVFRLGLLVLTLLTFGVDKVRSVSSSIFLAVFLISLISLIIWRKYKRSKLFPSEAPFVDEKYQRPDEAQRIRYQAQSENRGVESDSDYVKSKSFTDYSDNIVDPWDIKDKKPPWEL